MNEVELFKEIVYCSEGGFSFLPNGDVLFWSDGTIDRMYNCGLLVVHTVF